MKIQSIQNFNQSFRKAQNAQSFKGLWGKIKCDRCEGTDYDSTSFNFSYYPFKNETIDEINANIAKALTQPISVEYNKHGSDISLQINIKHRLPFTEKQYKRNIKKGLFSILGKKDIRNFVTTKELTQKPKDVK